MCTRQEWCCAPGTARPLSIACGASFEIENDFEIVPFDEAQVRAAHQGVPPQPLPGGIWRGSPASDATVPMADNNSWPSLPGLFGAPFAGEARQDVNPPPLPPANLPMGAGEAAQAFPPAPAGAGAPVPPADIPNTSASVHSRRARPSQPSFFDTLFGG
jgi:penicillin-binding protein 1A